MNVCHTLHRWTSNFKIQIYAWKNQSLHKLYNISGTTCANFPSSSPLPHCYYLLELQLYNSGTLVCVMHLWDVMTFLTEVNKCAISWWYKIIFEWTRAAQPFLFYRIIKMHTSYLEFIWHTQTTHHLRTTALRIHRTSSVDMLKYNCKIRKP